jgi:hypothetical protein
MLYKTMQIIRSYCFILCVVSLINCSKARSNNNITNMHGNSKTNEQNLGKATDRSNMSFIYPSEVQFPVGFDEKSINAYIGDTRVNILDGWNSLKNLLQNESSLRVGKATLLTDGLEANASSDGGFNSLVIKSSKYWVEGGGRIGMSHEEVEKIYRGGYSQESDLKNYTSNMYCYLVVDSKDPATTRGFIFYFDEKGKVSCIVMGYVFFAE